MAEIKIGEWITVEMFEGISQIVERRDALEDRVRELENELRYIEASDWRDWGDDQGPQDFVRWAKSRAASALSRSSLQGHTTTIDALKAEIEELERQNAAYRNVCYTFCQRVEAGEVQSVATYAAMKQVLPQPADVDPCSQ